MLIGCKARENKRQKRIFYVYQHLIPSTKEPFYVGKGHGNRANNFFGTRSDKWFEMRKEFGNPIVEIVADKLTHYEALAIEKQTISSIWKNKENKLINKHF